MACADIEQDQMSRACTTDSAGRQFMRSVAFGLAAPRVHLFVQAEATACPNTGVEMKLARPDP